MYCGRSGREIHHKKVKYIECNGKKVFSFLCRYLNLFTWGVTLDIAHFDKLVGSFLHIVVVISKHVQQQILLNSWKHALQVPMSK